MYYNCDLYVTKAPLRMTYFRATYVVFISTIDATVKSQCIKIEFFNIMIKNLSILRFLLLINKSNDLLQCYI